MKIYLIAGESSGDVLGSLLMKAISREKPDTTFYGIGGPLMAREGLNSLFPMQELSVMGIAEILPKLKQLIGRIKQTVKNIQQLDPDILITIDAPDFCGRVVKALRDEHKASPLMVHYVAPTVWAWRPGRAKKIAGLYDGLLCLFPFEPPYFLKHNLPAGYVGHPVMEQGYVDASGVALRKEMGLSADTKILGLMFGSRHGEVERNGETIRAVAEKMQTDKPDLHFLVPAMPHLEDKIRACLANIKNLHILYDPDRKPEIFAAMDAALAVSGTVSLELAVANVPHAILYKMNPLTWNIVNRVIKVKYAHLANILMNKEVVPEFIQHDCDPDRIVTTIKGLLKDAQDVEGQRAEFATVRKLLNGKTKEPPSAQAARFILNLYRQKTDMTFVPYANTL